MPIRLNPDLPELLDGWEWCTRNGFYAACLFTFEYDCIVEIRDKSLHLSTGVAPIEIVQAVLQANKRGLPCLPTKSTSPSPIGRPSAPSPRSHSLARSPSKSDKTPRQSSGTRGRQAKPMARSSTIVNPTTPRKKPSVRPSKF